MVEEHEELQVVVASPPSLFDAAVLARTLYAGLGPRRWRLYVVGTGSRITASFIADSRLPVRVALERVVFGRAPGLGQHVVVVDPTGVPAWEVSIARPYTIVVDYEGSLARSLQERAVKVRGVGFKSLTYEAVAVIYELAIKRYARSRERPRLPGVEASEVKVALYVAKKVLESLTCYDNYWVLEPSTLAFALRHALQPRGLLVDLAEARIVFDRVEGKLVEELVFEVYDRRLRMIGRGQAVYDGELLRISLPGAKPMIFLVNPHEFVVCISESTCMGRKAEPEMEGVAAVLGEQSG